MLNDEAKNYPGKEEQAQIQLPVHYTVFFFIFFSISIGDNKLLISTLLY